MTGDPEVSGSIVSFLLADDTEDDKPASRPKGIAGVVWPNALTFVDFVHSIRIPIASDLLPHPIQIPSYMGLQAGSNLFQLAS
jgi:hypothetical protein